MSDPVLRTTRHLTDDDVRGLRTGRPTSPVLALPEWLATARSAGSLPVLTIDPFRTPTEAAAYLLAVSRTLGTVLPQGFDGELVREVRDRNRTLADSTARYSDTRHGGDFHTDGFHRPGDVPDVFTLYCHRQAATGGALVLIPVAKIHSRLDPDTIATLAEHFQIDTRDAGDRGPSTVTRPVLDLTGPAPRIHYLRRYIVATAAGAPLIHRHHKAFDDLDRVLADSTIHRHTTLAPGELALVDNLRYVHGRTEFTDHPAPDRARLLLRTWIITSSNG